MKRFLMLVAVAAIAGAMYVAAAPGSQQTLGPTAKQFAALKKQVASLSKKLKALKADEGKVKAVAIDADGFVQTCLIKAGAVPVNQFGDVNGTFGFGYQATPPAATGTVTSYRTALDVDQSTTPGGFLQGVDAGCISSSGAAVHNGRLTLRAERAR